MAKRTRTPVSVDGLNIDEAISHIQQLLEQETNLPPALRAAIEMLVLMVKLLTNRIGLNSSNSSKPPSTDANRLKPVREKSNRKLGGQVGHKGTTLMPFDEPDEIQPLVIDRRTLPKGSYQEAGIEKRQVVDIDIRRIVIEYQAQVLIDQSGKRFVAAFPDHVKRPIQYGDTIKAHSVYLSQFQLLPCERIQDYFRDQVGIPVSQGSIVNFNTQAMTLIVSTGAWGIIKQKLQTCDLLHVDETSINIGGKRHWLHCASNALWTAYSAHARRGVEAMRDAGIIPLFEGILCHDHWKPYYIFIQCLHALCNAHHLRELERAWDQDGQNWARDMKAFLQRLNQVVQEQGDQLSAKEGARYRQKYRNILAQGETECPPPDETKRKPKQRGKMKRSKSRNLLERLSAYETDVLRFMEMKCVPFTNNQGERDVRMAKLQQKISGCFRSMAGADTFCLTRGYISTCRKHKVSASKSLRLLFSGALPDFFLN